MGTQQNVSDAADTIICHDYFSIRGGGERLVLDLARGVHATLTYGYRTADSYDDAAFPSAHHNLSLPVSLRRSGARPIALAVAFWRARHMMKPYKTRIYSGVAAPFAAPKKSRTGRNIYYCHTPPRFLFDQRDHFVNGLPTVLRMIAKPVLWAFEKGYRRAVARMDIIATNSENTQQRIRHFLGRESVVVYPPVDTEGFRYAGDGNYFLSTARLTRLKRVDLIVRAFLLMPEKKVIIVSGGEELEKLKEIAAGAPNIVFRGWVDDDELRHLVGNATATIYLPIQEDFGMSPVESMAAGKPVIGVAEGGLLETIVPDETGILLAKEFYEADIVAAVRSLSGKRAQEMRSACERRAADFSQHKFFAKIKSLIDAPYVS